MGRSYLGGWRLSIKKDFIRSIRYAEKGIIAFELEVARFSDDNHALLKGPALRESDEVAFEMKGEKGNEMMEVGKK